MSKAIFPFAMRIEGPLLWQVKWSVHIIPAKWNYINTHLLAWNRKSWRGICSNPRCSWVTYFILSNFCNFSQLDLSTHPLSLYQFLSPYHSFIVLSNFCQLLTLCYLLTFYFIYAPYKCTCCTHYNPYSSLIVRTLSAPMHLSFSPGVFGHRAILMWGDRGMAGGFSLRTKWYLSDFSTQVPLSHFFHCRAIAYKARHLLLMISGQYPLFFSVNSSNAPF